jgi:predicted nucleic acid-binding protein
LVLDTSAVINLLACGAAVRVLTSCGAQCVVASDVIDEVKYHPIEGRNAKEEVSDLITIGLLRVDELSDAQYQVYVDLRGAPKPDALGVGESASIALAAGRGLRILLDDKKARRICTSKYSSIVICTSFELFTTAAKRGAWPASELRQIICTSNQSGRLAILAHERLKYEALMLPET